MSRSVKPLQFLRQLDAKWFTELMKHLGVKTAIPAPQKDQIKEEVWLHFIDSLEQELKQKIEDAFAEINDLATEAGIDAILELNDGEDRKLIEEIGKIENYYNQVIYCYIFHKELFAFARPFNHINSTSTKREVVGLTKVPVVDAAKKSEALAKELSLYFVAKEARGQKCNVEVYPVKDSRVCFIGYPEDYLKSDNFYSGGNLKKGTRRSIFEVIFDYYPPEGRLEVKVKGRKREQDLLNIFNKTVLGDDSLVPERQEIYNLQQLIANDCSFPVDPLDQIKHIKVTEVVLGYRGGGRKVTISHEDHSNGNVSIRQIIKDLNIPNSIVSVLQAKIQVKFPGKGNRGSVTAHLSLPDRSNLNDTPLHLKVKKYLKDWQIERAKSI